MKRRIYHLICTTLAIGLFLFQWGCQPDGSIDCKACDGPKDCSGVHFSQTPFPTTGFDYMPGAGVIQGWVDNRNGHREREHAWNIWAGLNQPANNGTDQVIWQTWKTATQAYQDDIIGYSRPMKQKLKQLVDYPSQNPFIERTPPRYLISECLRERYGIDTTADVNVDGCQYQFNGDVLIAGVAYNQPAFDWIRNKSLYLKDTLLSELKKSISQGIDNPGIGEFPPESIVLKPMLWPVKRNGYTPLPVWDNLSAKLTENNQKYPGFENMAFWKRAVAITPDSKTDTTLSELRFMYNVLHQAPNNDSLVNIYNDVKAYGLEHFYSWKIDSTELAKMSCNDRLILDLSASWCYGRPFEAGDHLVLVAMHMFTKEFPAWTMQTAWWHDHPDTSRFSKHRPANLDTLDSPWNKYLMVSTYGQAATPNTIYCNANETTDSCWPVAYNPYIELGGLHPIATNCRNCHIRAGWTLQDSATNYLANGGPSSLQYFDTTNTLLFNNVIRTDFQWAIPDRVLPNPTVK